MGALQHQQHRLIAEVSHQINSPLAAIRNALFLAASRTHDEEVMRYLILADQEVSSIASRIKGLRASIDECGEFEPSSFASRAVQSMKRAA